MDVLTVDDIKGLVARISALMDEKREELIRLDGAMGDGDLGLTMSKGFRTASEEAAGSEEPDAGKLLMKVGMTMARTAPSTMGTLVATGFMSGGKAVVGSGSLDAPSFSAFFAAFVEGIMRRGKAAPGEKTLVDVIHPAAEALQRAAGSGALLGACVQECYTAAKKGFEESRDFVAQHGRPAYYGEQSRGKDDPGAAAALFLVQGIRDFIADSRLSPDS